MRQARMKKIPVDSNENKYLFLKGDYVFELEKPQELNKEFFAFFTEVFDVFHVSWEVNASEQLKTTSVIALHDAPFSTILSVITLYQTAFKNNIVESYQIV